LVRGHILGLNHRNRRPVAGCIEPLARQLQASSALFHDVFAEYDPDNALLAQAVREVLEHRLEAPRLMAALARLRGSRALLMRPPRATPFAFPLLVEMFREQLTTEAVETRVARMVEALEAAAAQPR